MKIQIITVTILLNIYSVALFANESAQVKIARAQSAAPKSISDNATILDTSGVILQEGNNGWTCLPDTLPNDNNPICNDATWMALFKALSTKAPFTPERIGISYMLKGDFGAGVSNSNPYHQDHKNAKDYVETGPHLMIIVPKVMLKGLPESPSEGGPYVMWGDTPYAHIMVPIDNSKIVMQGHQH